MATIQWYPGHMAKAIHQVQEKLPLVDLVLELVDARIPAASRNPEIEKIIQQKPHLIIMTKKDLADPQETQAWLDHFAAQGQPAMAIDSMARTTSKQITAKATSMLSEKLERQAARGIQNRVVRAICVGIPNVGKSTLLNHIVNRKIAVTADRPGVTKNQQWLKTGKGLELLDTPGILWPKFEDQVVGQKLALTGAIKEQLFANDDVALLGLSLFKQHYPDRLLKRYHLTEDDLTLADPELLMKMTAKAGMKEDFERFSASFLLDIRKGRLGRFTADWVETGEQVD